MVQKRSRSQKRSRQQRKSRSRSRSQRRRSQRGGVWYNPLSWFSSEPQYSFGQDEESIVDKVGNTVKSGLDKADMALANASSAVSEGAQSLVQSTTNVLNSDVPILPSKEPESSFPSIMPSSTMGGRSRSRPLAKSRGRSRSSARYLAKAGGQGLGLSYYATPVEGVKVAQPTYFENYQGGRRRRTRTMKRSRSKK